MAKGAPVSDKLVQLDAHLYHAIDLPDFETYCEEWALLSRQELERHANGIRVPFYTDGSDKKLGIFDRAFGNLSYFWKFFWSGGTPNAYGPITLAFKPSAFDAMADLGVTLDGANKRGFNLDEERLRNPQMLAWNVEQGEATRFFEVSTSTNRLTFDLVERIVVQPITIDGATLEDVVVGYLETHRRGRAIPTVRVDSNARERAAETARLGALLRWSLARAGRPGSVPETLPEECREWFASGNRNALIPWCGRAYATMMSMRAFAHSKGKAQTDPSCYPT